MNYYSQGGGYNSLFRNIPPVTKNLLLLNLFIYVLQMLIPGADRALDRWCALYYFSSPGFYPYQLFTYMFLHASFMHIFFNMFALWMFGRTIEYAMGSMRFLFFYLTCGIGAGLIQEGVFAFYISHLESIMSPESVQEVLTQGWYHLQNFQNYMNPDMGMLNSLVNSPMVGASGAIYGVLLAFGYLFPNQPIYLYFVMPIKAKWLIIGYFVLELVYGVSGSADGVAHFAHLGGMIFGFLLLWYWKRKGVFNNHWFF
ncbi:MAG: rhomboid family intramembrane serine protease [Muribaculaceae bacterium]|nr:rhomboid family intramembrane serine protease [Muribaculaceae bacterium]